MLALTLCASSASALAASGAITVVSREDGSGTRVAFVELMGVEVKAEDGSKADMTTEEAVIANSTDVVMQNVASDPNAIGYISLGSLNETVKAVSVDGVAPSVETVADGSYKVARPFYIATKGEPGELAADFIAFILSAEGQAVVGESYIKVDDAAPAFEGALPEGKLVVAGSSSVTPVMEKLVEAYLALNDKATIEIQMSDSTAGMTGAIDGTCDIGMASRELKESEAAELNGTVIAMDGIAVVVNNDSDVQNLTSEQVRAIYTGEIEDWADVQ